MTKGKLDHMTARHTHNARTAGRWLFLAVLLVAIPRAASAAVVTVAPSTTIDGVGATATINVSITGLDATHAFEAADLRFGFTSAVMSVTGEVALSSLTSACLSQSNTGIPGVLQLALACASPVTADGVLFSIPVQAQGAGSTALSVTSCSLNEGAIACSTTPGMVTVPPPTPTPTSTPTATRTGTATRTATPLPTVVLSPLTGPVWVGGTTVLTGQGFTAGSVIVLFVATSSGVLQFGPYTPSAQTATSLTWNVPATIPLANGFASVQVVNTDQGYIASNVQAALLQGAAAAGLPAIMALNGVALNAPDPSVPLASVSTVVLQNSALTVSGTGFSSPVVVLYSSSPTAAALEPQPGGSATLVQVVVPGDIPTGPGALQVVNRPSFKGSAVVSVPIGERIRIDGVSQAGATITVRGAGFSARTIISLFNLQGSTVVNLGGLLNGTQSLIPFTLVSSNQLTFAVPAGAVSGPAYVQLLNPPFIAFTSTGSDPDGAFNLVVP